MTDNHEVLLVLFRARILKETGGESEANSAAKNPLVQIK